jgi:hypothetical protein
LARKLVPKYIGPYKVLQDFRNQSFKLELPAHLKRRGVHDVFHSSLLRIHVPNDDRLFPGRMDTQIGGDSDPDTDDEWAVDKIRTHAGSREISIFKIVWKSGDVTWLPYYQIRHLQALETYLELMGVDDESKLVTGKGKPPQGDLQIYLGAISLSSALLSPFPDKYPLQNFHPIHDSDIRPLGSAASKSPLPNIFHSPTAIDSSPNSNLAMPMCPGINHPLLARRNDLEYFFYDNGTNRNHIIHVGQIMQYLDFDHELRYGKKLTTNSETPYGYLELVFRGPVRSGFFPFLGRTGTVTGPKIS